LLKEGTDRVYGARPLRRAVQRLIEDELSDALLRGDIVPGDRVQVIVEDGTIKFTKE